MKKNLLTLFVLLMTAATGAWAENVAIGTKAEWDAFAANVNNGMSYSGQTVVLTADIGSEQDPITEMVGGMKVNGFVGTFDGCGHTIHVNITSDGEHVAPFRFISGATIKNVRVTGSVEGGIHCAGLVGAAEGGTTCVIRNCEVAASITCSKSHCGGVLGHGLTSDTTISNCLFSGSITGTTSATGIFYGWGDGGGSHKVSNCLSAGTYEGCAGVDLGNVISSASISVVLSFRKTSGGTQGDDASQMSATELAGVLNFGFLHEWQVDGNGNVVPIMLTNSLEQDAEGYYLLGSVDDWKIFASLVQTTPTANAKMTADIDLGDDQTMIGTESIPYQGSFDGQGHTLTVTYNTSENSIAPFRYVSGEAQTIENLHVDGSIITSGCAAGGIACAITGNLTIKNCWVSAQIQTGGSDGAYGTIGGICSYCDPTEGCSIIIEDCMFSGAILYADYCGSFMSHVASSSSSVTMRRGLSIGTWSGGSGYQSGTFIRPVLNGVRNLETETLFYGSSNGEVQGTQATDAELADGTITAALGDAWVQQGDQPMLKIFCAGDEEPKTYTITLKPVPADEVSVTIDGVAATLTEEGKIAAVEEGAEVTLTAKSGYQFKGFNVKNNTKLGVRVRVKSYKPGDTFDIGEAWICGDDQDAAIAIHTTGADVVVPEFVYNDEDGQWSGDGDWIPCDKKSKNGAMENSSSDQNIYITPPSDKTKQDHPLSIRVKSGKGTQEEPYQFELVYDYPTEETFTMPDYDVLVEYELIQKAESHNMIVGVKAQAANCPDNVSLCVIPESGSGTTFAMEFNGSTGWFVAYDGVATENDKFKIIDANNPDMVLCRRVDADDNWVQEIMTFGDLWTDDSWKGDPVKWVEVDMSDPDLYAWKEGMPEPTGISAVETDAANDGAWYTLSGVKLDGKPTEKGIYICNGKKVVIK